MEEFQAAGLQIVGVSYDAVEDLKKFADAKEIAFPLLSDEGSETIRAYGLHHQDGYPYPGTILVGQNGVIQAKLFREGYQQRHANDELLDAAQAINTPN